MKRPFKLHWNLVGLRRWWARPGALRTVLEPLSWFAVAIGVGLTAYQLWTASYDRRVDASLKFAERFSSNEDLGEFRRQLQEEWIGREEDLARLQHTGIPDAVLSQYVDEVLQLDADNDKAREMRLAIGEVADMLDQLSICIDTGQCDEATARRYFCSYAEGFYRLYGPVLEEMRSAFGSDELGAGLASFVANGACN